MGPPPPTRPARLTPKERGVLHTLASGGNLDDAAREWSLTAAELRSIMRRVCITTGTRTPLEAVVWAARHGLL